MNKLITMTGGLLPICLMLLAACSPGRELADIRTFVEEALKRPPGPVEPVPELVYYEPFTYGASGLRSPFEALPGDTKDGHSRISDVKPEVDRIPEPLEGFALGTLQMVGTIACCNSRWALIEDSDGVVHRVAYGSYVGRNHGRVVAIEGREVGLLEIVPGGLPDSWIERPQTIQMDIDD